MIEPRIDNPEPDADDTLLVIVTGLSGSGKSVALRALEDLNFYCIDNLPVGLMESFARQMTGPEPDLYRRVAVGIDARNRPEDIRRFPETLETLRQANLDCEIYFLQADDDTLLSRFSETRRRHPLTGADYSLREAIARERQLLEPLADSADLFIDTSQTTIHELRQLVFRRMGHRGGSMSLLLESFAYKNGVPADVDMVFDARCLPNPHWDPALRPFTGRDRPVADFLDAQADAEALLDDICRFLERWLPRFEAEQRSYVTLGVGCTGGRHRSVYLVERLADHFRQLRSHVLTHHREL